MGQQLSCYNLVLGVWNTIMEWTCLLWKMIMDCKCWTCIMVFIFRKIWCWNIRLKSWLRREIVLKVLLESSLNAFLIMRIKTESCNSWSSWCLNTRNRSELLRLAIIFIPLLYLIKSTSIIHIFGLIISEIQPLSSFYIYFEFLSFVKW